MQKAHRIFASTLGPLRLAVAITFIWIPFVMAAPALAFVQTPAQEAVQAVVAAPVVPQQVRYSGKLPTRIGDTVEAVFRIYAAAEGGEPLWTETQRVTVAEDGSYAVLLGGASPTGLPQAVFAGGVARWLGVSVERAPEQDRVLLSSVPYAMKSADAESLAGHAASDFVTQAQLAALAVPAAVTAPAVQPNTSGTVTGSGTAGTVPLWTGALTQGNSEIVQVGSDIGINQPVPAATLDVGGTENVNGVLSLPALATATPTVPQRSQLIQFSASAWSTKTNAPVTPTFKLLTNFVNNNTANASGQLELHFQQGTGSSTVLSIAGNGVIAFAPAQTFPGTIKGVAAASPVTATTTSGSVALGLDTTALETTLNAVYPQLGLPNTFTQTQTMTQGVTVRGEVSANLVNSTTGYQLGENPIATGNFSLGNASLGFSSSPSQVGGFNLGIGPGALNSNNSGAENIAVGGNALAADLSGSHNTAVGVSALDANTAGTNNTAIGESALSTNTVGTFTTAVGFNAGNGPLGSQIGGADNTYIGFNAGPGTTNSLIEATAIGAAATVSESYALILGGTAGDAVNVGIGTAAPFNDYALDVEATTLSQINSGVVVNAGGGNLYLGMTNGVHKFRVDTSGDVFGTKYLTSGADFAESFAVLGKRSKYEPGDLLVIDPSGTRRLALAQAPYSKLVAGIYSTKPGVLATPHDIDDPRPETTEVPLAVVGVVPCKATTANGPIRVGDLLVTSSSPGYAMRGTNLSRMLGAVVGKVLEPLPKGSGVIQVLVTLQ